MHIWGVQHHLHSIIHIITEFEHSSNIQVGSIVSGGLKELLLDGMDLDMDWKQPTYLMALV